MKRCGSLLRRLLPLLFVTLVVTLFALYYFGYYDIAFIKRPASFNRTFSEFLASLRGTEPPVTEPVTEPPVTKPPVTTPPATSPATGTGEPGGTETPATTPPVTEPDGSFSPVSALQKNGWMLTDAIYDPAAMLLGTADYTFDLPSVLSHRQMTTYRAVYVYATPQDEVNNHRTVVYEPTAVDRPAVSLYMGYVIYDTGEELYLIDSAGRVLTALDGERYHPAYTRDRDGRPLFFEETTYNVTLPAVTEERDVLDEAGNVTGTETVTVTPAHEETFSKYLYYYVSDEGKLVLSDYRDSVDNRGLSMDYPAWYGVADDGSVRHVRLTELYYTPLEGADRVMDVTEWAYAGRTGYYFSKAYPFRESRGAAEYTYEMSVTQKDGTELPYTITSLVVVDQDGKIVFRPYSMYRYQSWYVIEWLSFPDTFGPESLGFFYFDHGLMRVRRMVVDYTGWIYQNRTMKVLEDKNILIDTKGNEYKTPAGFTVEAYSEGILLLKNAEGRYCYFDYQGIRITDPLYTEATGFVEGLAVVRNADGLCGVIDRTGSTVVPFSYSYISQVSSGLLACYRADDGVGTWTILHKMARAENAA